MTLTHYWAIIVKQWRLIIMCFILVGLGAFIGSKLMTPLYQSVAIIQVAVGSGSNQADYTSLLASDQLVQTEATLATSDPVLRETAAHYKGMTVDQLSREVTASPRLNTQLFEIDVQDSNPYRAAAIANDIASTLIKQQTQMTQQDNLFVVQEAQPTTHPVQPNILLNTAAGLLAGLLLGLLLAILIEQLDTRVRTPEAVTALLGRPTLATVWLNSKAKKREDMLHPPSRDPNAEAYRLLRTNIGFLGIDKPLQTLMVTSMMPGDGKSVIASNLAIFMAKAGKTTLLIDADMRRPSVHQIFQLSTNVMGLSNAILAYRTLLASGESTDRQLLTPARSGSDTSKHRCISLEPFIHAVDIPNLWVMPSGPLPPNPPELLDSRAMQRFLTAIAQCGAEIVIFDAPLIGLSDVSILASKVDGTLLVVDVTRTRTKPLKQAIATLEQAGAHILGSVVNKLAGRPKDTIYYYNAESSTDTDRESYPEVSTTELTAITRKMLDSSWNEGQAESLPELPTTPMPSDEDILTIPITEDSSETAQNTVKVPRIHLNHGQNNGK